nr:reverse transcriptase domain-containing protein [Tanacetum cinerariifolium]
MRTRSSSNLPVVSSNPSTSNPKRRNRRRSKQPFILEESPVDTMADQRTMAELLQIAKLTHVANQQTSAVTNAMTAILKQFQATPPPASVKAVEEICVTCGGAHPYYQCLAAGGNTFLELKDNIQGYVLAVAVNYNQGNSVYHPRADQDSLNAAAGGNLLERRTQDVLTIIENKSKASLSNQTNEIKNMMAGLFQMNSASTSGSRSLPSNTVANSKGEFKPSPLEVVVFLMDLPDPLHSNIPYPSRMLKQKQQEKDKVQIQIFWQMLKQLHINTTLADALILMPKYQKMLKALLSNKEKLQELTNIPLNENCSAVILKKFPEKLKDLGKFLIPCGFSELKCKALADLESINLINVFNNSSEDILEDLFSNQPSGNPTFLSHPELTSPKVKNDIFDSEGSNILPEKL